MELVFLAAAGLNLELICASLLVEASECDATQGYFRELSNLIEEQ